MSTLRVNNVSDLGLDAVVTNGVVEKLALPSGSVLQVAQTVKTDFFTTTSSTYTDITGLSVSITPTSTSSKIYVTAVLHTSMASSNEQYTIRLVRNSTDIALGTAGVDNATTGGRAASGAELQTPHINFLDSPNTTSATTYKLQVKRNASTFYLNQVSTSSNECWISTITVMEIAG